MDRDRAVAVVFVKEEVPELRLADAHGIPQHRLEHWPKLASRRTDYAQHLRCRGLLLQRFGKLARALLLGVKQPDILDGNHRLVGKCGKQVDLFLREWLRLGTSQCQDAD